MIYFDKRWKQTQHLSASCSFKQILARWCLQFKLVFTLFLQNNCKAFFLLQSMQQQAWSSCSWRNIWLFLSLLKCFSVTGESFSKSLTQSIFHYIYWLWTPPPRLSAEGHTKPQACRGLCTENGFSWSTTGHLTAYYCPNRRKIWPLHRPLRFITIFKISFCWGALRCQNCYIMVA